MQILEDIIATFGSAQEARQATLFDTTKVIEFLIKNENYKKAYFTQVGDALIFEKERFLALLATRELASSYTKFSNKIGLGHKNDNTFLKAQNEVVLHFPYKDCILKGAQDKDKTKSQEIFFNEILAREEIDVLFAPKVLQNFELIESANTESSNDSQNTPQSIKQRLENYLDSASCNLLLKGNNLLALHTLKKRKDIFGQVKLIYIDPPYNTGNDSFNYNDRFFHSTWLTFMKNRLEIARQFLRDDGVIFIQCDDNEQAYLKVLCDEIFGRENFVRQIIWRIGWVSGFKTTANIVRNHDTILLYAKNIANVNLKKVYLTKKDFQERFNDENRKKIAQVLLESNLDKHRVKEIINFIETIGLPEKYPIESTWNCSQYDKLNSIAIVSYSGEKISKLLQTDEFDGQKSEKLIQRIIEISTNEGDLVMDFFAGSGTTLAVAHKMNRRYVGIEQMDYIKSITKERLKKVVSGEQGGVSKTLNFKVEGASSMLS